MNKNNDLEIEKICSDVFFLFNKIKYEKYNNLSKIYNNSDNIMLKDDIYIKLEPLIKFYSNSSDVEDFYTVTKWLWFFDKFYLIKDYNKLWLQKKWFIKVSYKYLFNSKTSSLDDICMILCKINQIKEKDLSKKIDKYIIKSSFKYINWISQEISVLIDDEKIKHLFTPSIIDEYIKYSIIIFYKNTWDEVKKWDLILKVNYIQGDNYSDIPFYASVDGILENFVKYDNEIISKNELLFIVHTSPSDLTLDRLKNKKYNNVQNIEIDKFTWNKEIKWNFVFWKEINEHYDSYFNSFSYTKIDSIIDGILDCIYMNSEVSEHLWITINYLNNKDYLIIRYFIKDYKLSIWDKILFLLENWEILEFIIVDKPYKVVKWINEIKILITLEEINKIKVSGIKNWQIEFLDNWKKIKWENSEEIIFWTKKIFIDYSEIIENEIENYKPLLNKEDILNNKIIKKETCYVYLMHDIVNWYHKIWISNKPEYREKTLQSEKPSIEMVTNKKFPNRDIALAFEQALHRTYQEKRIRWEWFNLDEFELNDLKQVIKD